MAEITAALTLDAGPAKATTDQLGASATKAAQAVDGLSASQRELIARSEKVAAVANTIDIQNKKAVSSYLQQVAAIRATAQQIGVLAEVEQRTAQAAQEAASHQAALVAQTRALRIETGLAAASQIELGAATGLTKGGLNSLRASVQSFAASMLGAAPGVAQFTGALGTMALGSGVMIAILAGMAAISYAWDKITESARKSKEENEKAIKVLEDFQRQKEQGPGGEIGASADQQRGQLQTDLDRITELRRRIASLNSSIASGTGDETDLPMRARFQRELEETQAHYRHLAQIVATGEAEKQKRVTENAQQEQSANTTALTQRLAFNQKDSAARREALSQLAKDKKDYDDLLKKPFTADNSKEIARLASEMKSLDEAMNPKTRGNNDAAQARSLSNIAEQEERRVAAAKALDIAASQGQAAYDRELHSQELKNKLLETEQRIRADFLDKNGKQKAGSDAAMQAEIARAQAAVQAQDELGQHARASLDIEKDESVLAVLKAKQDAYDGIGGAIKDATVEEEYAVRVSNAMAIADDAQRAKKLALAAAIRDQTYATNGSADAAAKAKRADEDAQRAQERRAREIQRTTTSAIEQALTDVSNGQNPARAFGAMIKAAMIRAIAEALSEKFLASKFAALLGIGVEGAAKTQDKAALTMKQAAEIQKKAAEDMLRANGMGPTSTTPGTTTKKTDDVKVPAWVTQLKKAAEYAAVAYGGYQAGQATGEATYSQNRGTVGNYVVGAVGGAISGAVTGAAIGSAFGPVGAAAGAAIGAVAGFIGGIVGVHKASKEAAEATKQLRDALDQSMQSLRNRVNHDDLGEAIRQANEERKKAAKEIEDAYAYGDKNSANVKERNRQLAEMNALEDKYIAQLKEEAAAKRQYLSEDLDVEQERARATIAESEGNTAEAKRLRDDADRRAYNESQERRLDDYRRTHDIVNNKDDAAQYAQLQNTVALNEQAFAVQQNTKAVNDLTTSLHNAPAGFKYQQYVYDYATPRPPTFSVPTPTFPTTPLSTPQLSRSATPGSATSASKTMHVTFNIDGTKSSRDQVKQIAVVLKAIAVETLGSAADASDGWDLLA